MKSIVYRAAVVLVGMFVLTSCTLLGGERAPRAGAPNEYVVVKESPSLVLPSDLAQPGFDDRWPVPEIYEVPTAKLYPKGAPAPTTITVYNDPDIVRISKLGERRWVILAQSPDVVWPKVKHFLSEQSIGIHSESAENGLIVTDWVDVEGQTGEFYDLVRTAKVADSVQGGRDYFLMRVEHGMKRGSAEVHIRYVNTNLTDESPSTEWPSESSVVQVEAETIQAVATSCANEISNRVSSILGTNIESSPKSVIELGEDGYARLRLHVDFDRSWAAIVQALRRAEVDVLASDRDTRTMQIDVKALVELGGDSKKGLLSRLVSGRGSTNTGIPQGVVLQLSSSGDDYLVSFMGSDGQLIPPDANDELIQLIYDSFS